MCMHRGGPELASTEGSHGGRASRQVRLSQPLSPPLTLPPTLTPTQVGEPAAKCAFHVYCSPHVRGGVALIKVGANPNPPHL